MLAMGAKHKLMTALVLTVQQVADLAQVKHMTVRRAIEAGKLEAFHVGRCLRISRESAEAWVFSRPVTPHRPSEPRPPRQRSLRHDGPASVADLKQIREAMAS